MIAYVDASVLLRVALGQSDSLLEWRNIKRPVSSALIVTECLRTLDRIRLRKGMTDEQVAVRRKVILNFISALEIVEIEPVILNRAAQPMPTELGTLDAIHLVTALIWQESTGSELVMATHDVALALAAQAHGMDFVGVPRSYVRAAGAVACRFKITGKFCAKTLRATTISQPLSCACSFKSVCTCDTNPIVLTRFVSGSLFIARIIFSGSAASQFRSKITSEGFSFTFSSTVALSRRNSTDMPNFFAISMILAEKNRSVMTARIFLG